MFLDKVYDAEKDASPDSDIKPLVTPEDIQWLSRKELNGRQIKNLVRTAQALAKSKGDRMDFRHLKKVLSVSESFDNDLRGTGRLDNMHAYA